MKKTLSKKKTKFYIQCQCCLHFKKKANICKCTKGHSLCKTCIQQYIHTTMSEGKPATQCIAMCTNEDRCDGTIAFDALKKCLGKNVVQELIKQETINAVKQSHIRDLFTCAHCGYQFSLVNKRLYKVKYCPICNKGTCVRCGRKEHPYKSCQKVKCEERLNQQGIFLCPKCKVEFVKENGCNMMTCPKCKINFCYICGKVIPKSIGYNHFSDARKVPINKCPLKSQRDYKNKLIALNLQLKMKELQQEDADHQKVKEPKNQDFNVENEIENLHDNNTREHVENVKETGYFKEEEETNDDNDDDKDGLFVINSDDENNIESDLYV